MEEKSSNRLTAAILKDYRLKNIECDKYQLIFVTADLGFLSKPFLSWLKKLPRRLTYRLYVYLILSEDSPSCFGLTH